MKVDCYESGLGSVGGLGTFHNWLFPGLVKLHGESVDTFSMDTKPGKLMLKENYKDVNIWRPSFQVSENQAYSLVYDTFHGYDIDASYINHGSLFFSAGSGRDFFTKFSAVPYPFRMSEAGLFSAHDWFSYIKCGFYSLLLPHLPQDMGIHSTEPGRRGGIYHKNFNGTSNKLSSDEIAYNANRDFYMSFHHGERIIRDLEFVLTYKILKRIRDTTALMTVSKIHRKEYLLGVKAHGGKPEEIQNRVYSMYHGVDTDFLKPSGNGKNSFTIGIIGRCSAVKGFDIIPELASVLAHEVPEVKLHVATITGLENSVDNILFRIMKDSERLYPKNLIVEDKEYDKEGKLKLLNSWSALLAPSRYEPQGQIDLEAMACGIVPIVGLGGLREKVVDGMNGIWVDPFNPRDIAEKIIQLWRSSNGGPAYKGCRYEAKYDELCRNARETAEKIWSLKRRVEAHRIKNQYLLEGKAEAIREELEDITTPPPLLK